MAVVRLEAFAHKEGGGGGGGRGRTTSCSSVVQHEYVLRILCTAQVIMIK